MARSMRLFDLIQALRRRRRPISAVVLAQELGVSRRTIYRDIDTLIALGAPVVGEAGVGYVLRPGFMLPPLMLTNEELESLALGALWVTQRADPELALAARNALAKISAVVPVPLTVSMEEGALLSAPVYGQEAVIECVDPAIMRRAIRDEQKMQLCYTDQGGASSERIVWPIAMIYFDAVRLLVAWCETRQAFRHFRTDRVTAASVLEGRYPKRRNSLLKVWRDQEV